MPQTIEVTSESMPATPAAAHMAAAFRLLAEGNTSPHIERRPSGAVLIRTGEPDPFANIAIGYPASESASIADTLAQSGLPALMAWIGEGLEGVREAIGKFGFTVHNEVPAMSLNLRHLGTPPVPEGYSVERLTPGGDAEAWAQCTHIGYGVPILASRTMSPVHAQFSDAPDAPVQYFQARHGDEVAAVSVLVLADGLAGIYCVATREEHRGKGLGAAVTAVPLIVARELGYSTGVLQSSQAGYSIYRRLGFVDDGVVDAFVRSGE